jgi:hypothetical protein
VEKREIEIPIEIQMQAVDLDDKVRAGTKQNRHAGGKTQKPSSWAGIYRALKKTLAPTALRGSTYRGHIEHRTQSTEHGAQSAEQRRYAHTPVHICKHAGGAVFAVVYCT